MELQDLRIVENPALVRDHALDKLRTAISSGFYLPGTRLVERELCEALGVSRTSVREALRQLQSEGLVEVGRRRNINVAVLSEEDADDIYLVRELLETVAIRRFVSAADDAAIQNLQRIHKDMRKALGTKDNVRLLATMAAEFYDTILVGSGSRVLHETARQLMARVNYLRLRAMSGPGRLAEGMHEWDRIMEAIVARDAAAAAKAMANHLKNSRRAVLAALRADIALGVMPDSSKSRAAGG